jgi:hypothetical protein
MTKDNGGPAFPTTAGQVVYSHGMSMRDWFAGQALAGAMASDIPSYSYQSIAKEAYALADAMLAARGGDHE